MKKLFILTVLLASQALFSQDNVYSFQGKRYHAFSDKQSVLIHKILTSSTSERHVNINNRFVCDYRIPDDSYLGTPGMITHCAVDLEAIEQIKNFETTAWTIQSVSIYDQQIAAKIYDMLPESSVYHSPVYPDDSTRSYKSTQLQEGKRVISINCGRRIDVSGKDYCSIIIQDSNL